MSASVWPGRARQSQITSAKGGITLAGSWVWRPVGVTVRRVIGGSDSARYGWSPPAHSTISSSDPSGAPISVNARRMPLGIVRLGAVVEEELDRPRRMPHRVVRGGRDRRVARPPLHPQPGRGGALLPRRERDHAAAIRQLQQDSPALVHRVVAAHVRPLADQPRHADVGDVALLVGLGDQDHVAAGPLAAARESPRARRPGPRARPSCRRRPGRSDARRAPRRRTAGPSSCRAAPERRRYAPSASGRARRRPGRGR